MITERRLRIVNILALTCAIWFLLLGWVWVYFANVIFVFPVAIAGFFLWRKGRAAEKKLLNRVVGWMLLLGMVISAGALAVLSFYN
jgi:hypothetical protein